MALIIDAGPMIAGGDARDAQHGPVRRILQTEPAPLVIPAPVTAEIDHMLRRRGGATGSRALLRDIAAGLFWVEGLTRDEHGMILDLQERYAAFDLGLADLSIVVLAHRYHTRRILTFDERHFRSVTPLQGGFFTLLPADPE